MLWFRDKGGYTPKLYLARLGVEELGVRKLCLRPEAELLDSKFDLRLDYRNPQEKREMIKADGNHTHGGYHIHRSFN